VSKTSKSGSTPCSSPGSGEQSGGGGRHRPRGAAGQAREQDQQFWPGRKFLALRNEQAHSQHDVVLPINHLEEMNSSAVAVSTGREARLVNRVSAHSERPARLGGSSPAIRSFSARSVTFTRAASSGSDLRRKSGSAFVSLPA